MKSKTRFFWTFLLLIFLSGCSATTDFVTNPGSTITSHQSSIYMFSLIMAAVVFLIVEGGIIIAITRFRRRKDDVSEPTQVHGNVPLEIIWTAIPVVLVVILFIFTINTMNAIAAPVPSSGDIKVNIVGHQWWWEFDYPDLGIVTADELVIPAGTPVQITLTSVDVIHSFWIPQLAGKTDAVPGQINRMWISADQPGTFDGQCSEFCGIEHALMRERVVAVSPADFQAWVTQQQAVPAAPQTDLAVQGAKLVTGGACAACHTITGTNAKGKVGPNLTHLFSRSTFAGASFPLNDANLTAWLTSNQAMKPGNLMAITVPSSQISAVLAYLKTLK
jgi:cytochrome c oxidase subunit 2